MREASNHAITCCLALSLENDPVHAAPQDVVEGMRGGNKVPRAQVGRGSALLPANRLDWNFDEGGSFIEQPRNEIRLKSESKRVRMPSHYVVPPKKGVAVVVAEAIAAE